MPYQRPLTYTELLDDLTEVVSLISIEYAGRVFYWASRAITIESRELGPIQYQGGVSVDWRDALSLFNDSPPLVSVSLDLFFPDDVDVARLVAEGHDLSRATGEFSLYPIGEGVEPRDYEDRIVILSGTVNTPDYGEKGQPVSLSLQANPFHDFSLIPEAEAIVNASTWPDHDPKYANRVYPIVFGSPGVYKDADGTEKTVPGSPGLAVEVSGGTPPLVQKVLIAGHRVAAGEVTLWGDNTAGDFVSSTQTVALDTDGLGREVSIIDGIVGPLHPEGVALWITWDRLPPPFTEAVGTGGLINDRYDGTRTGAGEVMDYFLRRSTLDIDVGRWRAVGEYLDTRYRLAGYLDEVVSPWDYIKDNLLPLLPVSLIASGNLAPVLWRREATKKDAVGHLTAGPNMSRVGAVGYERQKIENEIRLTYAPSADENKHNRTVGVLTEQTELLGYFTTEYSRASGLRYGPHPTTIETDVVFDSATASEILQWKHRSTCFPYRVISYRAAIRYGFLKRGDLVTLTDEALYLDEYLAMVRDIQWKNGRPVLTLVLIDDPPREDRP